MSAPLTPQSSTPSVTLDQLQRIVDSAKAKCPDLATRLDKAAGLLVTRRVERGESGRVWFVQSETDPEREYAVAIFKGGPWVCECQDHERRGGWCKHGLAVALLKRCQETAEPLPAPAVVDSFRVLAVVA